MSDRTDEICNVLISVPNNNPKHVMYLPTIWVSLKSYAEHHGTGLDGRLNWLEPILHKTSTGKLLAPYDGVPIHVLGLSCYSWNMHTNMALAAEVRRRYPECLIVAGGPHLDYRNHDFFAENPAVDAIVLKDGEIPFTAMLEQVVSGRRDLAAIPGLVLPPTPIARQGGSTWRTTAPPVLPQQFAVSPWLENAAYIEGLMTRLRAEAPRRPIGIAWEIDRGCPYDCVFCDWGSNTGSKLRSYPVERVQREADWIARNRIHIAFLTVANFGMVHSDEAALDAIIEGKRDHGFPRVFIWNNAKNNVDRVVRMNHKAFTAGLVDFHILSVQSLDDDVLAAMRRTSISKQRLLDVVDDVRSSGIPCVAQLIFGGPADNLDKFVRSITGLMELGIHDEYVAYPFDILPNAPANDPAFKARWGIRTITRKGSINKRDPEMETSDYSTFIVATSSYDEREFVSMFVQGRLLIALHNSGLTMLLSRYLRRSHGIAYHDFYRLVIDRLFNAGDGAWATLYRKCEDYIAAFVGPDGAGRVESIEVTELPGLDYWANIEEYFAFAILTRIDDFYADLNPVLRAAFGERPLIDSLIRYQRAVMIDPSYDRRVGRRIDLDHDWPAYFQQRDTGCLAEPTASDLEVHITRSHSGSQFQYALDWWETTSDPQAALVAWVNTVIGKHYQRVERAYFSGIDTLSTRERLTPYLTAAE